MRVLSCYRVKQTGERAADLWKSRGVVKNTSASVARIGMQQERNAASVGVIAVTQTILGGADP